MTLTLAFDIALMGLLAAAIGVMLVLNRRLSQMRSGRAELERLFADLAAAVARADASFAAMRGGTEAAEKALGPKLARAETLRDELQFLTERAGKQADLVETAIRQSRPLAAPPGPERPKAPAEAALRPLPAALAGLR